jgi:hypothetical protein
MRNQIFVVVSLLSQTMNDYCWFFTLTLGDRITNDDIRDKFEVAFI